jgi:hypothetical protein
MSNRSRIRDPTRMEPREIEVTRAGAAAGARRVGSAVGRVRLRWGLLEQPSEVQAPAFHADFRPWRLQPYRSTRCLNQTFSESSSMSEKFKRYHTMFKDIGILKTCSYQ